MNRYVILLVMVCSVSAIIIGCSKLDSLAPPTIPMAGVWQMASFEISELPAWYVAKTRLDSIVRSPTYTIYDDVRLALTQNVRSYTFTSGGSFSELYLVNGGIMRLSTARIDQGSWTLSDTIVHLTIANNHPRTLTYIPSIKQLATEKYPQTAILENEVTLKRDTVSYMVRLFYYQSP